MHVAQRFVILDVWTVDIASNPWLHNSYSLVIGICFVICMQIVILLSQIRVNSMAIVRMKSSDVYDQQDWFRKFSSGEAETALTSSVEQVCFTVAFHSFPLSIYFCLSHSSISCFSSLPFSSPLQWCCKHLKILSACYLYFLSISFHFWVFLMMNCNGY